MKAVLLSNRMRAAATLVAVAVVVACNGSDVAAPARPAASPASELGVPAAVQSLAVTAKTPKPVQCTPHSPVTGRGRVGPHGGVITIGASRLIIPRGALGDAVIITGTATGDASSTIDFQPHGLHFRKPVTLMLSGAGCTLPRDGDPSIVYLGTDGQVLERFPADFSSRRKLVIASIPHFSGYAIAF